MNVTTSSLVWSYEAAVVAENVTYSNVTTETLQWDSDGGLLGSGDETRIVEEWPDSMEVPMDDLVDGKGGPLLARTRLLTLDDSWFVSVQKVRMSK